MPSHSNYARDTLGHALVRMIQQVAIEAAREAVITKGFVKAYNEASDDIEIAPKGAKEPAQRDDQKYLSTPEVAARLGVTPSAVFARFKYRKLPGRGGKGRQNRMRLADVIRWEKERAGRGKVGRPRDNGAHA